MKAILLPIALLIVLSASAQNAYYDALYLRTQGKLVGSKFEVAITAENKSKMRNVFKIYVNDVDDLDDLATALAVKYNNPFISVSGTSKMAAGAAPDNFTSFKFSSIGGIDVTNFADGLAKFLVKRTKEELSVSFFDHLLTDLKGNADLQKVFPDTYKVLLSIETDIYQYNAYIDALREAFTRDISSLPLNIGKIGNLGSEPALTQGLAFVQAIASGTHPTDLLNRLSIPLNASNDAKNLASAAKLIKLFSNSLKSKDSKRYWISSDSLRLLTNDETTFKIYLGLISQSNYLDPIVFSNGKGLKDMLIWLASNIASVDQYESFITTLIQKTEDLDGYILQLKNTAPKDRTYYDYYQVYNSSANLLEFVVTVDTLPQFGAITGITINAVATQRYFKIIRLIGNIYIEATQKKFGALIIDTAQLLDILIPGGYAWRDQFIKYGSFAVAVSQAQNSDDVEAAIESVVLPAGSSRIKRETDWNIALNGYLGPFTGWERIKTLDSRAKGVYGLTAPVGISISRGHSILFFGPGKSKRWQKGRGGWSTSLFISMIDVGAIASYRFSQSQSKDSVTTSQIPKVQLKNIISPGAFLSIGIPRCPLSVNFGAQVGPNLRSVSSGSNAAVTNYYADQMYWRFSVALVADIPLINLYTKSK